MYALFFISPWEEERFVLPEANTTQRRIIWRRHFVFMFDISVGVDRLCGLVVRVFGC
jgi:hypothetical protein